jgi:hypothetical protein
MYPELGDEQRKLLVSRSTTWAFVCKIDDMFKGLEQSTRGTQALETFVIEFEAQSTTSCILTHLLYLTCCPHPTDTILPLFSGRQR